MLGECIDQLPAVWLKGTEGGNVARCTGDHPIRWGIHAEEDPRTPGIDLVVWVGDETVAHVQVFARQETKNMWEEAQQIAASLLWSRLRAVLRDRARLDVQTMPNTDI